MIWLCLILFLAFGGAISGDSSLLKAICKIVLTGGSAIFVLWLFSLNVYISIVVIIIGILIFVLYLKLSPTKDNRTTNNFSTPCETENFDEDLNKNETNYSDFQKELQAQMKTPIQINNEKKEKMRNNAISWANSTYIFIKKGCLEQAKNGKYSVYNGGKKVIFDYIYKRLPEFIGCERKVVYINKSILNPTGECENNAIFYINDKLYYDTFILRLQELSLVDAIKITPLMINNNSSESYTLPFAKTDYLVLKEDYNFILRCEIDF